MKERGQAELGEAADGRAQEQGIQKFKLGVARLSQAILVDRLPKCDEIVKLLGGRGLLKYLPPGSLCKAQTALSVSQKSKSKGQG